METVLKIASQLPINRNLAQSAISLSKRVDPIPIGSHWSMNLQNKAKTKSNCHTLKSVLQSFWELEILSRKSHLEFNILLSKPILSDGIFTLIPKLCWRLQKLLSLIIEDWTIIQTLNELSRKWTSPKSVVPLRKRIGSEIGIPKNRVLKYSVWLFVLKHFLITDHTNVFFLLSEKLFYTHHISD